MNLNIILLITGIYFGNRIPDIDQWINSPIIYHRSLLTHSFIPLFIFSLILKKQNPDNRARQLFIGLGYGLALHLAMDLFPKNFNFYDHACIHSPWFSLFSLHLSTVSLGSLLSPVWILSSVFICLLEAVEQLRLLMNIKLVMLNQIILLFAAVSIYFSELKPGYILWGFPNPFWGVIAFIVTYISVLYLPKFLKNKEDNLNPVNQL